MNSPSKSDRITIDVRLDEHDSDEAAVERERQIVRKGLTDSPRYVSSKYFYDDRGSELFERITELPEYYQTRTEQALLAAIAAQLVETTEAAEIVELGSGASAKTRVLLDAFTAAGVLERYVPIDVSEGNRFDGSPKSWWRNIPSSRSTALLPTSSSIWSPMPTVSPRAVVRAW